VDRQKVRRYGDQLPYHAVWMGFTSYVVGEKLFGLSGGGLPVVIFILVLSLIARWVLRQVSGLTWREALWPPREPSHWEQLETSLASVEKIARSGRKLQAIKMYRELTGTGIKEAKAAVEAMTARPARPD
jgi:hypothetical protein